MSCTYSVSGFNGLQWYRQDSGRGLKHLFSIFSAGDVKQEGRLRATLLRNGSSLHITALQPEDSATYFCAVATQCSPCTCKLYLKLELGRGGMTEASAAGSEPRPVWKLELGDQGGERMKAGVHLARSLVRWPFILSVHHLKKQNHQNPGPSLHMETTCHLQGLSGAQE
jgi:hypothetical protein